MTGLWVDHLTNVQVLGGSCHNNYIGVAGEHALTDTIFRNHYSYLNTGQGYYFDNTVVNTNLRWCTGYSNNPNIQKGTATYSDCTFY